MNEKCSHFSLLGCNAEWYSLGNLAIGVSNTGAFSSLTKSNSPTIYVIDYFIPPYYPVHPIHAHASTGDSSNGCH